MIRISIKKAQPPVASTSAQDFIKQQRLIRLLKNATARGEIMLSSKQEEHVLRQQTEAPWKTDDYLIHLATDADREKVAGALSRIEVGKYSEGLQILFSKKK